MRQPHHPVIARRKPMADEPAETGFAQAADAGCAVSLLDRLVEAVESHADAALPPIRQRAAAAIASRDLGCIASGAQALVVDGRQAVLHGFELAASAEHLASSSGAMTHAMDDAGRRMRDTLTGARGARALVLDLAKTVEDMAGLVDAFASLSRQANLLAVHATIEAARAGEVGRDFACVAGDVKTLSEETGSAARDMRAGLARLLDTAAASVRSLERIVAAAQDAQPALAAAAAAAADRNTSLRQVAQHATDLSIAVGGITQRAADVANFAEAARTADADAGARSDDLARTLRQRLDRGNA